MEIRNEHDPRLPDFVGADGRGMAMACTHCFELVTSDREATEDGTAHLDCAAEAGSLHAHICTTCRSYSETEIEDEHGRCAGCAGAAADRARDARDEALAVIEYAIEPAGTDRIVRACEWRTAFPLYTSRDLFPYLRLAQFGLVDLSPRTDATGAVWHRCVPTAFGREFAAWVAARSMSARRVA
jgi:hypothetical protein